VSAADPDGPDDAERAERAEGPRGRPAPAFAAAAAEGGLLAGIGQRIGARLLDGLIIGLPLTVLVFAASDISEDRRTVSTPLWVQLVAAAVSALYEIVLIRTRGQTVGKRVLGIKVVRITDGALPDWTASVVRYVLPVVPVLIPVPGLFLLSIVIYLAAVVHPLRQGWHDRAAGTIVVKAEPPSRPSPPARPGAPPPGVNGNG
jgi:uncharacterized RDD family membrane protein YckC